MAFACKTPGCKVAETGKCIEGFKVDECPHVVIVEDVVDNALPTTSESSGRNEISIHSGLFLNVEEATDVLRSGQSRVLTIIGPSDSGKTTFSLSIYDAFLHGYFDQWNFSGSLTLPGFESRSYYSRAASGQASADTPRSLFSEGLGFLHLLLHDGSERINLLISERSGEHYERVANNVEDAAELYEVRRADYILLFVDGGKLASDNERHGVKTDFIFIVKSLVDSKVINKNHRIAIVLTKMDVVLKHPQHERALRDFNDLVVKLRKLFLDGQDIIEFRIASRSADLDTPHRLGVAELLRHCLQLKPLEKSVPSSVPHPDRYFLNFSNLPVERL